MVVYSCQCLNIQVFAVETEEPQEPDSLENCPLTKPIIVQLVDPGFKFVHNFLVQREKGVWTTYYCLSCKMLTHAINVKANLLVINSQLMVGENAVKDLKNKPEFSKVFKIILHQSMEKVDNDFPPQSYEILQKQLSEIAVILHKHLQEKQEQMERSIQNFEQNERARFERESQVAKRDKTQLVSVLFNNSERGDFTALPEKTLSRHRECAINTLKEAPLTQSKSMIENSSNQQPVGEMRNRSRMRDSSPDVFAMEELEIESNYAENDYPERSESSLQNNNKEQYSRQRSVRVGIEPDEPIHEVDDFSLMSTSVPISMPGQHFRSRANTEHGPYRHIEEFEDEAAEFDDIPRHMQALSESIQERDRYIFGERPRQRVNTADFTQVRPHWK